MPTTEIRAEWAAQRIKGLSFFSAAKAAFFGNKGNKVKSLISEFNYPRFGPGQMWDAMTDAIEARGRRGAARRSGRRASSSPAAASSRSRRAASSTSCPTASSRRCRCARSSRWSARRAAASVLEAAADCATATSSASRSSSTARICSPTTGSTSTSRRCASAASRTSARGRRGWSRIPTKACVGLEYFCFAGDDLWTMSDDDLVELAARELEQLGLAPRSKVERGYAIRVPKAYPIYDADYAERVAMIRTWLDGIENLQQVGRNGLHRYNNSDHSMLTAMRAVDNLLAGRAPRHLGGQRGERLPRDATSRTSIRTARLPRRPRCRRSKLRTLSRPRRLASSRRDGRRRRPARRALAADRLVVAAERRRGADAPHLATSRSGTSSTSSRRSAAAARCISGSSTSCRAGGRGSRRCAFPRSSSLCLALPAVALIARELIGDEGAAGVVLLTAVVSDPGALRDVRPAAHAALRVAACGQRCSR